MKNLFDSTSGLSSPILNSCDCSNSFNAELNSTSIKSKSKLQNKVNLNSIYKKIFKMNKTQNQKKKIMKRDEYDREQQMSHREDYQTIPIKRTQNQPIQSSNYYLCGGVTVEADPMVIEQNENNDVLSNGSSSISSQFMQVLGVEIFEEKGLVEVKLQNTQKGLTDFLFLSNMFNGSQSQEQQIYGKDIENYHSYIQGLLRKKQLCEQVQGFDKFSEIVSNKFDKFDDFLSSTIQKIKQNHRIFTYRVYKFDLFDFEFKMKSYGYSEDFIKTLGYTNVSQFKDQIMHQGLPEMFTLQTRQNIAKAHMKQISQKKNELNNISCKLVSLDGIEVDTHLDMHLIPFYDANTPIYNNLFDCSAMIEISTYDISKDTLRQVINMRREINFDFNDAIKQDIYYELESQLFVDRFYSNSPLKIKKQQPLNAQISQKTLLNVEQFSSQLVKQNSIGGFETSSNADQIANDDTSADTFDDLSNKLQNKNNKVCGYRILQQN